MAPLPPGPRSSLLSILAYLRDPIGCLLPMVRRYGDTFTFPGKKPLVIVCDPAGIKAVFTAPPDSLVPLNRDFGDLLGERALILLEGAEHRRARKLMMPPFHGARMRAYGDAICRIAAAHTAGWTAGARVSMLKTARAISLDVILQAVFGVSEPERSKELAAALLDIVDNISPLLALFPGLRRDFGGVGPYASFLRRRRRLYGLLDDLIAARRAAPAEDILSLLISARDEAGQPMPDDELRDHLVLLVFAGHETTAIALGWAFDALHRPENAAALLRLRAELAALGADAGPEEIARLPYLEAVCNETLRRYPLAPAPNPRRLLQPMEIGAYTLPAGTGVAVAIGAVHFREDLYPEPMRFRPERFLERTYSPFEFVPFGGGSRRCLGAALAVYEMKLVLAALLRRFRLRLSSLRPDRGAVRAANVGPARGVKMIVEEVLPG